jgi:hypothetical protein
MITFLDWGIWLIFLLIIFTILWFYRNSKTESFYNWFLKGFLIKSFGALAFTLIFVYYYKSGDSIGYFNGSYVLGNVLFDSPSDFFELILHPSSKNFPGHLRQYTDSIFYSGSSEEWLMVKLMTPLALITFNSYLAMNLIMSLISFWGSWKLLKVFKHMLPNKANIVFYSTFLIPSVIFWGSGIMKDTLTHVGLSYLIYTLYTIVIKKQFKFIFLPGIIIWFFITYSLKSYIIIAFMPTVFLLFYFHYKAKIKSGVIRFISTPFIIALIMILGFFGIKTLSDSSEKYQAEKLEAKVKGFHTWHSSLGGSSYDLGVVDYSATGVLMKLPASLNVTFFRPYIWEAKNPVVLISAIESLAIFVLFILILIKSKLRPFKFLNHIFLKSSLLFIIIFGFTVGFTSYNFGALGRYKIPVMPLFLFTLLYIYSQIKERRNAN